MKKDDLIPPIEGIQIFAQPLPGEDQWQVCVQNLRAEPLDQVLITSTSYYPSGEKATTTLRHQLNQIEPGQICFIERLDPALFGVENEYWFSAWAGSLLLDHPFRFSAHQLSTDSQETLFAQ